MILQKKIQCLDGSNTINRDNGQNVKDRVDEVIERSTRSGEDKNEKDKEIVNMEERR